MKRVQRLLCGLMGLEMWVVMGLAGLSVASERFLLPAVCAAAGFRLVGLAAGKGLVPRAPANWGVLGLCAMLPVSLWATALPEKTWVQVLRLLAGVGVFYAAAGWARSPRRAWWSMWGLGALGLALGGAALFAVDWTARKIPFIPVDFLAQLPRLGEGVHPNVMAGGLVLLIPMLAGWWLFDLRRLGWLGASAVAGLLVFMTAVVVLTKSRGGYLGVAAGLALLVVLRWPRWGWSVVLGAGLLGAVALYAPASPVNLAGLTDSGTIMTLEGRMEIWSRGVYMLRDFPLTGVGMGSFTEVADTLYPFFSFEPGSVTHAHNLLLQIGADLGVPGLAAWVAALVGMIAAGWGLLRSRFAGGSHEVSWKAVGAGCLCSLLALVTHGVFDAVVWGTRASFIPWVVWGVCAGAWGARARMRVKKRAGEVEELAQVVA